MLDDPETYVYNGVKYNELGASMLWGFTHFDGPMSGLFLYNGDLYFGHCHQNPHTRRDRYFWLYKLTEDEKKWHRADVYRRIITHGSVGMIHNPDFEGFDPFPFKEGKDRKFDRYTVVQNEPIGYSRRNYVKLSPAETKALQAKYCPSMNVLDKVLNWFRSKING